MPANFPELEKAGAMPENHQSKHLKGRLGSHVSDAFCIKGGRLGSHVSDAFWIKGGRLGSKLVFHGFSWFQVGFYGFSWFQVGFSVCVLYSGPTIQSRPCRPKAGFGLVKINVLMMLKMTMTN